MFKKIEEFKYLFLILNAFEMVLELSYSEDMFIY
jgi:hypothetical protein